MVECTALEMRHGGNSIGGSNPSLSASFLVSRQFATLTAPMGRPFGRSRSRALGFKFELRPSLSAILSVLNS